MYIERFINTQFVNTLDKKNLPLILLKQFAFKRKNALFVTKPQKTLKTVIKFFQLLNYMIQNHMKISLQSPKIKNKTNLSSKILQTCYEQLQANEDISFCILLNSKPQQNILQTKLFSSNITTTNYHYFQIDYLILLGLLNNTKHVYQFSKCVYQLNKINKKNDKKFS